MFKRLKEKWKLSWTSFVLVFSTFAIGGSSCGYLGRKLLSLTGLESGLLYYTLYIVLMCLLWPLCVIVISIPLGQFGFFRNYLRKMSQTILGCLARPQNLKMGVLASKNAIWPYLPQALAPMPKKL
jgi:K+-transporting ATPase A subunit